MKVSMKKNYYYLIVGLLTVLLEIPRTLNGLETTMTFHIIGIENIVIGVTLIIMAFQKNMEKVKFTTWLILAILLARWVIIALFTILNGNFEILLIDSIAIFSLTTLLLMGTRVKSK